MPPLALAPWEYLIVPLAAAVVALVAHPDLEGLTHTLLIFEPRASGSAA